MHLLMLKEINDNIIGFYRVDVITVITGTCNGADRNAPTPPASCPALCLIYTP